MRLRAVDFGEVTFVGVKVPGSSVVGTAGGAADAQSFGTDTALPLHLLELNPVTGTILEGVTRDTMKTLAVDHGHRVEERRIDIDEWRKGVDGGHITEVFACGTAAVITSIGTLRWRGGELTMPTVKVPSRPKGLPMASTFWPTCSPSESPR